MKVNALVSTGLKVLAVCLLFAFCQMIGFAVSGMGRTAQPLGSQPGSSLPVQSTQAQPAPAAAPQGFLVPFLIYCLCSGGVVSLLIRRSRWHGWKVAAAIFVAVYGISCVANAIEAAAFLSSKVQPGMTRSWVVAGFVATALFSPLAVLVLGRWKSGAETVVAPAWPAPSSAIWRAIVLVVAFVFFYLFFGYYVAWQNPAVRQYYGGTPFASFFAALQSNWVHARWIYPLATFRGVLYILVLFPLVRMFRGTRWQVSAALALFVAAWTTGLLLPNPLMPPSVAHTHFVETFLFSLVFGGLTGGLLAMPPSRSAGTRTFTRKAMPGTSRAA